MRETRITKGFLPSFFQKSDPSSKPSFKAANSNKADYVALRLGLELWDEEDDIQIDMIIPGKPFLKKVFSRNIPKQDKN